MIIQIPIISYATESLGFYMNLHCILYNIVMRYLIYRQLFDEYLNKCLAIVDLSTVTLDEGKITGSFIKVPIIGSKNSSGAS